jgi:imidazole glycerol-phosphate synthase subunit HisH
MIVIIDYGVGNIGSILNMLKKIGTQARISYSLDEIAQADKIILPGVGAFDSGMRRLNDGGFVDILNKKRKIKTPILGICLGFQLMTLGSEEGKLKGLGWFDAQTIKFNFPEEQKKFKIPYMGWNYVKVCKPSKLFKEMFNEPKFYLVHSYYIKANNETDVLCKTEYSIQYASAMEKGNIYGVQFHPEKSHKYGMKLLKNFSEL